ncbi:MAG: DNA topoisomerase IV subunit A [Bacilli bacterium]|jgi:topoisomerase-4 subunit A
MAKKKNDEPVVIKERIDNEPLEEIMGDRYATYAKYVIQDRAIPDARDGLKPVQRRIIFSMYKEGNTSTKPTKKCAHAVGTVMGKYHPHGDSSIYEALARMSQDWKVRYPLIDFQGNNGSIDGDVPAAYRYTESRLSEIADELIRDIDKKTVDMNLTFDDTDFEPNVLPARFPNLLVNGSEGIAVAMATEIPPHNLGEVVDAIIYRINHRDCAVTDLLAFIKGPDFPTGGIIYNSEGLKNIYETGRGRIEVVSKCDIVETKGQSSIIVSEIPYKAIKIDIVHEIDLIRHNKIIDGIIEVRDESDMNGIRVVIDLKRDVKADVVLKYLFTKTTLATSYSANMVAIVSGRPKTMTLIDFLDSYITHQIDVITRRSKFDLTKFTARLVIVNGLIKAISILDKVVEVIRASSDKQDAKKNLSEKFGFNEEQSEAIVMLQLYKLSHTDISVLENEKKQLEGDIANLKEILADERKLDKVIISDLKAIVKKYGDPRRTQIIEKSESKQIDKRDLIAKDDVMISISKDGYIKRSSLKSYKGSGENVLPGLKPGDATVFAGQANTADFMLAFTNNGNYLFIPIYEIMDTKWKDEGKHINYLISLNPDEKIIQAFAVQRFREDLFIALISRHGQIKRTRLSDFVVARYTRPVTGMRLLKDDELADACICDGNSNLFIATSEGYSTFFNENELTPMGIKAGGVKAISQLKNGFISGLLSYAQNESGKIILITNLGHTRLYDISRSNITPRLGKQMQLFRCFKSDMHKLVYIQKVETMNQPTIIRTITNAKKEMDITIDDYHLTPLDKYAKTNVDLPKSNYFESFFKLHREYINDSLISHIKEADIGSQNVSSAANDVKKANDKEKISISKTDEKDDNYKQISIFDDDLNDGNSH